MVNVVQLVERQFVALVVVGSSPIVHPIFTYCIVDDNGKHYLIIEAYIKIITVQYLWFTSSVGRAHDF